MNVSRAPGAPCGSVFGCFLVLMEGIVGFQAHDWLKMVTQMVDVCSKMIEFWWKMAAGWLTMGSLGGHLSSLGGHLGARWLHLGFTWGSLGVGLESGSTGFSLVFQC